MVVMNVGEGQSLLLQEGAHGILVDTGHPGKAAGVLQRLQQLGIEQLDFIVLTHLHPDHAGGYFRLREAFPDTPVLWNGHPLRRDVTPDMVRWVRQALLEDQKHGILHAGDRIDWRGWQLDVLWPRRFVSQDLNNHSLVLLLQRNGHRWLVMGDAGIFVEKALLENGRLPTGIEALVVGHHGGADASSDVFLEHLRPGIAVISVDPDNIRGYPAETVIRRLQRLGARILRTDVQGEIVLNAKPTGRAVNQ